VLLVRKKVTIQDPSTEDMEKVVATQNPHANIGATHMKGGNANLY
jgi:hypothetical protein